MANFNYNDSQDSSGIISADQKLAQDLALCLEISLRDTCILNYRRSYDKVLDNDWDENGKL